MPDMDQAIISIRPNFAEAILSGIKTVELRRRIPPVLPGMLLWIYATRPVGAVVGYATVESIVRGSPTEIWAEYGNRACIGFGDYNTYFDGADEAVGLILKNATRGTPVGIHKLRQMRDGFHPPQVIARISRTEGQSLRLLSRAK